MAERHRPSLYLPTPGGRRAVVLGAGSFGTAVAVLLARGGLRTTLQGKAVGEAAVRCRQAGVPCHAVCGSNALSLFDQRILDLQHVVEAGTIAELERAGEWLAARL